MSKYLAPSSGPLMNVFCLFVFNDPKRKDRGREEDKGRKTQICDMVSTVYGNCLEALLITFLRGASVIIIVGIIVIITLNCYLNDKHPTYHLQQNT